MSVFSRLFGKKKVQPEVRVNKTASLESLSPEALIAIALAEKGEQDDQLRLGAIARLNDINPLVQLAFTPSSHQLQRVARQCLAVMVDDGAFDFDLLATRMAD